MRLLPLLLALLMLLPPLPARAAEPAASRPTASVSPQRLPLIRLHGGALARPEARITVEQLDELAPQTEWTVLDPYRQRDVRYSGIQLRDLVAKLAPEATQVRMRAVNGYIITFERREWEKLPILLATRDEGQRMAVLNKGPARVIYFNTLDNQLRMQLHAPKWIWQVIDVEFIGS